MNLLNVLLNNNKGQLQPQQSQQQQQQQQMVVANMNVSTPSTPSPLNSMSNSNNKNKNKNKKNNKTNNKIMKVNKNKINNNKGDNKTVLNFFGESIGLINEVPKNMNQTKRHYFIGTMIKDVDQINMLNAMQSELIHKYKLRDYYLNFNNKYMIRYVYMGYLTPHVASKYMDRLMKPICKALTEKFTKMDCHYVKVSPKFDKSINWLSLFFEDEQNYLKKAIIPYLHDEAIAPLFPKRFTNFQPMIDLIHFKSNTIPRGGKIEINIPSVNFMIDHISLISGRPTQAKLGYQAIHDNLSYEEEAKYTFPFSS